MIGSMADPTRLLEAVQAGDRKAAGQFLLARFDAERQALESYERAFRFGSGLPIDPLEISTPSRPWRIIMIIRDH